MNFDEEVDRYNTNCLKYDFKSYYNVPDDVYPMWIADMDFRCCDEILNALQKKLIMEYLDILNMIIHTLKQFKTGIKIILIRI